MESSFVVVSATVENIGVSRRASLEQCRSPTPSLEGGLQVLGMECFVCVFDFPAPWKRSFEAGKLIRAEVFSTRRSYCVYVCITCKQRQSESYHTSKGWIIELAPPRRSSLFL